MAGFEVIIYGRFWVITEDAAIFWSERYYRRLPVSQLVTLAAHLVVAAGKINPEGIEGLEIAYCDASTSGFRRLTLAQNRALELDAKKRGKQIRSLILGHSVLS
jgi:hypothetical protein